MNSQNIINKSDNKSKSRAKTQNINAKLYKVIGNKVLYTVTSSKHDKQYIVTIQLLDLTSNVLDSLQQALTGNIRINCTCPAFLYKGFKYITYKQGIGIEPETRSPDKTNPDKKGMACKHILVALEKIKSDYSSIYNLFKSNISKQSTTTKDKNTNKANRDSNVVTDKDLELLDKFKSECAKLYSAYNSFLSNNDDNEESFEKSKYFDGSDPSKLLNAFSKPVSKMISNMFIGKLKSINDIIRFINQKKNGFNILLKSDITSLTKRINASINSKVESYINDIILTLLDYS